MFSFPRPRRNRFVGFTLVELMVVIAIISILAVIAIPAYNNYSLKSKFTEVVLATVPAPHRDRDMRRHRRLRGVWRVVFDQWRGFSLPGAVASGSAATARNSNIAALWAFVYASDLADGLSTGKAASDASSQASGLSGGSYFIQTDSNNNTCIASASAQTCYNGYNAPPLATVNSYMNSTVNPDYAQVYGAWTPTAGSLADLPCVGPAGSGCSPSTKYAQTVSFSGSGVITATATSNSGLNQETFVLTPSYSGGRVDWAASGTCKTRAAGSLC